MPKRYRLFFHVFHSTVAHRCLEFFPVKSNFPLSNSNSSTTTSSTFTNTHKTSKTPVSSTIQPNYTKLPCSRHVDESVSVFCVCTILIPAHRCHIDFVCTVPACTFVKGANVTLYTCARNSTHTGDRRTLYTNHRVVIQQYCIKVFTIIFR